MAGRFEGLREDEWKLFEHIFSVEETKGRGQPKASVRSSLNSLMYILITGCRWCDIPYGPQWASKSASHRRLQEWYHDGKLDEIKAMVLGCTQNQGMIRWDSGAVDGSFFELKSHTDIKEKAPSC